MSVGEATQLIKAIGELVGVVIWPSVALFVAIRFSAPISNFVRGVSEFTFKAAGVEATAKTKQVEAALAIGAAIASQTPDAEAREFALDDAKRVVGVIAQRATQSAVVRAEERAILWVDDRPENNTYERRALEALGARILLSTSTEDALSKLSANSFDVIISDMGRPPDPRAGYTLLEAVRKRGITTPFLIYAGSNAPEHRVEARRRGAQGSTNRADELVELVLNALRQSHA